MHHMMSKDISVPTPYQIQATQNERLSKHCPTALTAKGNRNPKASGKLIRHLRPLASIFTTSLTRIHLSRALRQRTAHPACLSGLARGSRCDPWRSPSQQPVRTLWFGAMMLISRGLLGGLLRSLPLRAPSELTASAIKRIVDVNGGVTASILPIDHRSGHQSDHKRCGTHHSLGDP